MTKNTSQKEEAKTIEETLIEVKVSRKAYDKLNELKRPGESYTDLLRRMLAVIDAPPQSAQQQS